MNFKTWLTIDTVSAVYTALGFVSGPKEFGCGQVWRHADSGSAEFGLPFTVSGPGWTQICGPRREGGQHLGCKAEDEMSERIAAAFRAAYDAAVAAAPVAAPAPVVVVAPTASTGSAWGAGASIARQGARSMVRGCARCRSLGRMCSSCQHDA